MTTKVKRKSMSDARSAGTKKKDGSSWRNQHCYKVTMTNLICQMMETKKRQESSSAARRSIAERRADGAERAAKVQIRSRRAAACGEMGAPRDVELRKRIDMMLGRSGKSAHESHVSSHEACSKHSKSRCVVEAKCEMEWRSRI